VSTALVLSYLFPRITAPDHFALNEQGALLYWRRPEPQPTDAEIAAAALPAAKAAKRAEIKAAARAHILARYPEWRQANLTARAVELVSLGEITGPEWGQMQAIWDWIKDTRSRSDLLEADVDNCTTVEAVEQLTIGGWPE
jgi:hypothetical protein